MGATGAGDGTAYTPLATGACSYPTFEGLYAALSPADFDQAASCGVCLEVTGPAGTAIVRVVDLCPECAPGDVDLSNAAFAAVAGIPPSRVPVTWTSVECPIGGPVRLRVFEGTNAWYQAFLVRDHRTPITSVEMLPAGGGSWLPLRREPYNVFVRSGGLISAPVRLRVTDVYGDTVEGELPSLAPGTEATAAGQFSGVCGS